MNDRWVEELAPKTQTTTTQHKTRPDKTRHHHTSLEYLRRKWISPDLAWHMWHLLTNHHLCDNLSLKKNTEGQAFGRGGVETFGFAPLCSAFCLWGCSQTKQFQNTFIAHTLHQNICQKSLSAFILSSFRFSFFPIIIFKIIAPQALGSWCCTHSHKSNLSFHSWVAHNHSQHATTKHYNTK